MEKYSVLVSNIGAVDTGGDRREAEQTYGDYVQQSTATAGRASGESVTLLGNVSPDILAEYHGTNETE